MKQEACLARNLASCFVIRVSALEACFKATGANSSALTDATRASDSALTARSCAPLELVRFSNSYIFFDHVVLLLNFRRAKLLDLIDRVLLLASLLHARKLHGHSARNFRLEMVTLAIYAEAVLARKTKEVFRRIFHEADLTKSATF